MGLNLEIQSSTKVYAFFSHLHGLKNSSKSDGGETKCKFVRVIIKLDRVETKLNSNMLRI